MRKGNGVRLHRLTWTKLGDRMADAESQLTMLCDALIYRWQPRRKLLPRITRLQRRIDRLNKAWHRKEEECESH